MMNCDCFNVIVSAIVKRLMISCDCFNRPLSFHMNLLLPLHLLASPTKLGVDCQVSSAVLHDSVNWSFSWSNALHAWTLLYSPFTTIKLNLSVWMNSFHWNNFPLLSANILSASTQSPTKPESIPKPSIDPTLVPLPGSELSGASLGESVCSMSPSQRSQSSSGEEEAYESDYISGDDMVEDQNETNDGQIFNMDADENVRSFVSLWFLRISSWIFHPLFILVLKFLWWISNYLYKTIVPCVVKCGMKKAFQICWHC